MRLPGRVVAPQTKEPGAAQVHERLPRKVAQERIGELQRRLHARLPRGAEGGGGREGQAVLLEDRAEPGGVWLERAGQDADAVQGHPLVTVEREDAQGHLAKLGGGPLGVEERHPLPAVSGERTGLRRFVVETGKPVRQQAIAGGIGQTPGLDGQELRPESAPQIVGAGGGVVRHEEDEACRGALGGAHQLEVDADQIVGPVMHHQAEAPGVRPHGGKGAQDRRGPVAEAGGGGVERPRVVGVNPQQLTAAIGETSDRCRRLRRRSGFSQVVQGRQDGGDTPRAGARVSCERTAARLDEAGDEGRPDVVG